MAASASRFLVHRCTRDRPTLWDRSKKDIVGFTSHRIQRHPQDKTTDRYGRTIAEIRKGSTNINQSLVRSGNAFVYWQQPRGCNARPIQIRNDARLRGVGVGMPVASSDPDCDDQRGGSGVSSSGGASRSGRFRCSEISSWSKAQELLKQGHTYLDRDGDGQACESLR